MKKVEKSASKNKHPIKLHFLIWRLQSANPEEKVITENQIFGSCPLHLFGQKHAILSFVSRLFFKSSTMTRVSAFERLDWEIFQVPP